MSVRHVHACALNVMAEESLGFDAFSANAEAGIFTLCDGANSCPDSGAAARWLSQTMAQADSENLPQQLISTHVEMCQKFPETGSTLLRVHAREQGLELATLGDSFLWVFKKPWNGFAPWRCIDQMPRDVDEKGHPTQLVGSEVCHTLHTRQHRPRGIYCAVLMSDGPGLVTADQHLAARMSLLGRSEPSPADLAYLCHSLALDAHAAGCRDDISVAMVWLKYT
jgi:serine/threonine protein phosphatase PrpC